MPTAVVTGATSGIGLWTAHGLARAGFDVVLACRDLTRAEDVRTGLAGAYPSVRASIAHLDLASLVSVRACADELLVRHPEIDLLVSNAGVFADARRLTEEGFEETMGVNFLGPMLLVRRLLPSLRAAAARSGHARLVFVGSAAAAYGRLPVDADALRDGPHGFRGYAASKLALVHLAGALAEELAGTGVTVLVVHPGDASTGIWRGSSWLMRLVAPLARRWLRPPQQAADAVLHAALAPGMQDLSGAFLGVRGERLVSRTYEDRAARASLLAIAREAIGT